MSFNQQPFIGVWRNELSGDWTLTLSETNAGFLAAALVIFVGIVASQAWRILSFSLHQLRAASSYDRDVFHQQLQAVLCNSSSHSHAALLTMRVTLGWRRHLSIASLLKRSLPVLSVSLVSLIVWSAAQLFATRIWSSSSNQFLIGKFACGHHDRTSNKSTDRLQTVSGAWLRHWRARLEAASLYESQCYASQANSSDCLTLPARRIEWTMQNTSCPFQDPTLCIKTNTVPILLDTGYIKSNTHLGINAPAPESIEYRKTAACSPMRTDRKRGSYENTTFFCTPDILPCVPAQVITWAYNYGPTKNSSGMFVVNETTFVLSEYPTIRGEYSVAGISSPRQWRPHPNITTRSDVHASIFFRTDDHMYYDHRVDDPWFYTSREPQRETLDGSPVDIWVPFEQFRASILGCIEEQELCNPGNGRCIKFTEEANFPELFTSLGFTRGQIASARRIVSTTFRYSLGSLIDMMAAGDALLASKTVVDGAQVAQLPVTQWRSEVARWFSISLIILQMGLLEGATGPLDPEMKPYWVLEKDPDLITSCHRQRFGNAADARNFNLSVLIAVLVGGSVIIVLGSTIDKLVGFAQRLLRPTARGRFHWLLDSLFQYQRLAYEAVGVRPWLDADTVVPVSYGQAPEANLRVVSQPRLFHRMDAVHGAPFLSDAKDLDDNSHALDPYCIVSEIDPEARR